MPPRYAGFWRRVAASLIDTLLFSFILFLVYAFFFGNNGIHLTMEDGVLNIDSNNGLIEQALMIVITLLMWVKFLGTPGKLVLGCHVIDAKTHQRIKPLQAVIRYFAYFISLIPLGLGFLWIAWDKKKQGFHDKIAGTVVVFESTHLGQDESQKSLQQLMDEVR
ncbi:MAG TPA: RDD family protein [Gammaproteobacteria bacterium]|nr:RDD family protein [Gammaproteobacteria bacterium]